MSPLYRLCCTSHLPGCLIALCVSALTGCSGSQSALAPSGREADRIANLFWWMTGFSAVIWLAVIALAIYAVRKPPDVDRKRQAKLLILGGALTPTIVLSGLLMYGLGMLQDLITPAPEGSLRITVYGEQWWWRVRYEPPGRQPFELANEIRLPVGESVEFRLHSNNVIHSFWIPSLGGKMDMIPGRVNRLSLRPTKTGSFRGACAEYCGIGHAHMAFDAFVLTKEEFGRWMASQSEPSALAAVVRDTLQ